jgi:hypothetical protein
MADKRFISSGSDFEKLAGYSRAVASLVDARMKIEIEVTARVPLQ